MRDTIHTQNAPAAIGPYAQAIRVGELLFTSGQIPLTPEGELTQGGIKEQTDQVLKNLTAILVAGGSSLQHVIKCTCFLADMNDFADMNEVYGSYFNQNPPARSTVEVSRLPRDVKIEIEAIARV